MPLSIDMQVVVDAPIDRVWSAVATQDGLRGWFNPVIEIDPRLGGWVEFHGLHGGNPYRFGGAIVEFDPPRKITWEWKSLISEWPAATLLTIDLADRGNSTFVEMHHHGWEALGPDLAPGWHANFAEGWAMGDELGDLKKYLEQGVAV